MAEEIKKDNQEKLETTQTEYHSVVAGKLVNPLSGIPHHQLLADVERFACEKNLEEHLPVLTKGALLAQHPHGWGEIAELSPEEREAIRYEHAHKWSHPLTMYLTICLCSIGAATQGWDQTGSNGANLSFPAQFGILAVAGQPNYERNSWLVGLINSAPYIGSAFVGCWVSDPLNNYFGRRGVIFLTALVLVITPICSGLTRTWQELLIVRLILGIGMGAKGSTVPIFAAENSPPLIRGALVMGWQFWTAFGIFLGFVANIAVADVTSVASWRLQLGSAFIPAFPLALGIFFCPESPRWLMKKNRYKKAFQSLRRLRYHDIQAARDLYSVHVALEEEKKIQKADSYVARFTELFTIPRVRRATIASGVVMLAQQMCGINIIAFYSSTIFADSGFTDRQALYASLGFGAVNWIFAIPAIFTIDTFGRRSLLLFTFPNMAWSLLAAAMCFLIPNVGKQRIAGVATFIYIFAAFYSVGEGPVPFAYSAEVFPLAQREQGMAWAVTMCLFWAAVLSISLPRMLQVLGAIGVFCFYAGLNMVAFVLLILFLPETKQRTLEELDQVFSIPTQEFIHYNLTKEVPYFFKRYFLFNRSARLEPLYVIEGDVDTDERPDVKRDFYKEGTFSNPNGGETS